MLYITYISLYRLFFGDLLIWCFTDDLADAGITIYKTKKNLFWLEENKSCVVFNCMNLTLLTLYSSFCSIIFVKITVVVVSVLLMTVFTACDILLSYIYFILPIYHLFSFLSLCRIWISDIITLSSSDYIDEIR